MEQKQALIDLDHLMRQTMNDRDLSREILQIFINQMQQRLLTLDSESPDLSQHAHSIKGSAKGIGAWGVADAAERVELRQPDLRKNYDQLRHEIESAVQEAQHLLMD